MKSRKIFFLILKFSGQFSRRNDIKTDLPRKNESRRVHRFT